MSRMQAEEALPGVFGNPNMQTVLGDNGVVHVQVKLRAHDFYVKYPKKPRLDKTGLSKTPSCFLLF